MRLVDDKVKFIWRNVSCAIAFIDDKKVYVKGSELGYALKTIERILEQNKLKRDHQIILHKNHQTDNGFANLQSLGNRVDLKDTHKFNELSKAIGELIKPEEDNAQLPYQLMHKRKKKRCLRPN